MSTNPTTLIFGAAASRPARDVQQAIARGLKQTCPACGKGALFGKYLKVVDACPDCGEALHHHRADDAQPYFTILIVGHIIGGGVLWLENTFAPATWVHAVIWIPATLIMSLLLLPRVKGALIGLQWALRMHGFDGEGKDPADPDPIEEPEKQGERRG
jgi:uncharacterized protein (DUF983 family)